MNHSEKGFTLIEIMIAIMLISVASLATTKLAGSVVSSTHSNEARMSAAAAANNILNSVVANISTGAAVPPPTINQQYIAGDSDIIYDLYTKVFPRLAPGMPQEVFVQVTVRHPALTKGSFSTQTLVMTAQ